MLQIREMRRKVLEYKVHIILIISIFCLTSFICSLRHPVARTTVGNFVITVKPGMGTHDIGKLLYNQGVIKSIFLFEIVSKMEGMENSLKAGEYVLNTKMTLQQIVGDLAKGENSDQQITIPEGYTVEQISKLLQEKQLASADKFKLAAQKAVPYTYMVNNNPNVIYKAEGYLFPNTYRIAPGATEEQIVSVMTNEFDKEFTPAMRARAAELGLKVKDVIILASLVEKEAKLPSDRPLIAGVFLNRLQQDMPLQSCATIQYILGYPKAELSVDDTEISSPYNTYQHMGLPPGPIANPGIAAINAVLQPKKTDYLYFVADAQGAHHFSKTYEEHLMAIEKVSK